MEQIQGFPKNLAYNLKRLQGSIIKQKITLSSDKNIYNANDRITFNFPVGRMIESRSIALTAKCTTKTAGNRFSRGGLHSLIENLQISANSRIIQSTQMYNYIFHCLADCSGYFSPEQQGKRAYEHFDPSISHTNPQGEAAPVLSLTTNINTGTDSYYFTANTFLGFFSSSAAVWDTNNLGQIQLIITLAPQSCLWLGANGTTTATNGNYDVENVELSMDTITFTNSLYYDLIKSQLEGQGLNIAYNDYLVSVGTKQAKGTTGITHNAQFSTNSLDSVIGTFRHVNYNTAERLLLGSTSSANTASSKSYGEILATLTTSANTGNNGLFNNSRYLQRCGAGIDSSSWSINSQPFTFNSKPVQIYNNTLQALDYANLDIASGGFHQGAITTGFYNSHYFIDILSLQNLSSDNNNWVSGLGGNGGIIQVQYNARFLSSVTDEVYPVIIGKVSKIMNIKIGRNIDIME